jgi:hypothetical protein
MPWRKGQTGNANGRPPGTVSRILRKLAQAKREDNRTRLEYLLDKLYEMAEGGNLQAIMYICDRLEGKPAQAVEVSGDKRHPLRIMYVNGNRIEDGSGS